MVDTKRSFAGAKLDEVLANHPLTEKYRSFQQSCWEDGSVSPRILSLAAARIGFIHGCSPWRSGCYAAGEELSESDLSALARGDDTVFSDDERAALAVAARVPHAHHELTDAEIASLEAALGPRGCVVFLVAAAFFDVDSRLTRGLDLAAVEQVA